MPKLAKYFFILVLLPTVLSGGNTIFIILMPMIIYLVLSEGGEA